MKNLLSILFIGLLFMLPQANLLSAQELSKEEAREWKDKARDFRRNPAALKALVEENDACSAARQNATSDATQAQAALNAKDRQLADCEERIIDLNQQVLAARNRPVEAPTSDNTNVMTPVEAPTSSAPVVGVVFKVQLGAFQKNVLDSSLDTSDNLSLENSDGLQKVIVGQFRVYDTALKLRDSLRQMGVKDAFIVAYRDGTRINVQDVIKQ